MTWWWYYCMLPSCSTNRPRLNRTAYTPGRALRRRNTAGVRDTHNYDPAQERLSPAETAAALPKQEKFVLSVQLSHPSLNANHANSRSSVDVAPTSRVTAEWHQKRVCPHWWQQWNERDPWPSRLPRPSSFDPQAAGGTAEGVAKGWAEPADLIIANAEASAEQSFRRRVNSIVPSMYVDPSNTGRQVVYSRPAGYVDDEFWASTWGARTSSHFLIFLLQAAVWASIQRKGSTTVVSCFHELGAEEAVTLVKVRLGRAEDDTFDLRSLWRAWTFLVWCSARSLIFWSSSSCSMRLGAREALSPAETGRGIVNPCRGASAVGVGKQRGQDPLSPAGAHNMECACIEVDIWEGPSGLLCIYGPVKHLCSCAPHSPRERSPVSS